MFVNCDNLVLKCFKHIREYKLKWRLFNWYPWFGRVHSRAQFISKKPKTASLGSKLDSPGEHEI